jgi:hypothetical protein
VDDDALVEIKANPFFFAELAHLEFLVVPSPTFESRESEAAELRSSAGLPR